MTSRIRFPLTERDKKLLIFLWRWRVATTACLADRFFPGSPIVTGYNRLLILKRHGFIYCTMDQTYSHFVWVLDNKGYDRIAKKLPPLRSAKFGPVKIPTGQNCNGCYLPSATNKLHLSWSRNFPGCRVRLRTFAISGN